MVVFIAIELDKRSREKISEYVRKGIKPLCRGGRWVDRDNYHLTLKYIGRASGEEINALCGLLGETAERYEAFILGTGRVGVFGKSQGLKARVLWMDCAGDTASLMNIRKHIEDGAVGLGFAADRRFSPHITLARDVVLTRQPDEIQPMNPVCFDVTSVSLMESRPERGGRVYVPLFVQRIGHPGRG